MTPDAGLGAQALAAFRAAAGKNPAAIRCFHAGAETVTALANELRWLKCTFHDKPLYLPSF